MEILTGRTPTQSKSPPPPPPLPPFTSTVPDRSAAVVPALSRRARIAAPLTLGAVAACGCAAVALADPGDNGVPLCWSRSVFGVDCPFCGGLRATNALLRGHFGAALDHNVILAVVLPVTVLMWVWWLSRQWRGTATEAVKVPRWISASAVILLVAFGIARNLRGSTWTRWLNSDTFAG